MYEATLFDVGSSEYLHFASVLLAPMLGFVFLYLLALPLRKLLFVELGDYEPPKWVLPAFALVSVFLVFAATTVSIALNAKRASASIPAFIERYHKERLIEVPDVREIGVLTDAEIQISRYDDTKGSFRVFVNGYRVFGSTSNCRLDYQCRPAEGAMAARAAKSLRDVASDLQSGSSIFHTYNLYALPHPESIRHLLVPGMNHVDLHAETTGLGDCAVATSLRLRFERGAIERRLRILPGAGSPQSTKISEFESEEIFYSAGDKNEVNIEPYGTILANGTYRLCDRIRLSVQLREAHFARDWFQALLKSWKANIGAKLCEIRGRPKELQCQ